MTYHNAIKYIQQAPQELPEEHSGRRLRLVWDALGNPQKNLRYLRLAGSNGKTVCAELLMSVYKNSNYTVGCLTMPPRSDIREGLFLNGTPLSFDAVASLVARVRQAIREINQARTAEGETEPPSELMLTGSEILLCAALLAFSENGCKLCLIESDHEHSDPTRFLPPPIAAAICGTIPANDRKEFQRIRSYLCHGIPEIVSAPQDADSYRMISDTCAAINCRLTIPSKSELTVERLALRSSTFTYRGKSYSLQLCGRFQISNAMVVLEILNMLSRRGYGLPDEQIVRGFSQTKLPCKLEILSISPTIIADSTHSEVAVEPVCESIADFRDTIGQTIRLCLPRSAIVRRYVEVLEQKGYRIDSLILYGQDNKEPLPPSAILCQTVKETVRHALADLSPTDTLLISGSYGFTSEIRYEILKTLGF
ncbi:MAG: hypothetical protein E7668_05655 [Ruminococcaceae bacterium]|nr:hypothetical protein [Oscillospiraceae bacterium]